MTPFSLTAPTQTHFARGARKVAATEIAQRGMRVLLVRGRAVPWVDTLVSELGTAGCAVDQVWSQGEPTLDMVRHGVAQARAHRATCIAAVGGGAVIDLGKAIAGLVQSKGDVADYLEIAGTQALPLGASLPFVAIPTTAGTGAEATRNAVIGVPDQRMKISLRGPQLVPDLAVVDPALTDGTPRALTLASGLDAITQLIESYLCNRANPVTDAICQSTLPPAISALNRLMQSEDRQARDVMARAGFLSGVALANSGLGIVHGLASVIGGRGAAHGAICGRLLAPGLAANTRALRRRGQSTSRVAEVGIWLGAGLGDPTGEGHLVLQRFVDANGLPTLQALGVSNCDIQTIAEQAAHASSTKANPVELDHDEICDLLRDA